MICEKTGAVLFLEEYDCYVRGDVYRIGDHLLARVNNASRSDDGYGVVNYSISKTLRWFDENERTGTIVCSKFDYFGYEGKEV